MRVDDNDILVGVTSYIGNYHKNFRCQLNTESVLMNLVWFREWIKNMIYGM